MRFVIVGAGRVGMRTARVLQEEDHEVTIIEPDETTVERLRNEGYSVVHGDASREEVLLEADLEGADGLAALSGELVVNLIACLVAKAHDCRTVLRVDADDREYVLRKYATEVDEVVYPERLGAIAATNALLGGTIRSIADIAQTIQLVQFTITTQSPVRGYTLSELELPADARLLAFGKAGEQLAIPEPDTSMEDGDRLVVISEFESLADVRRLVVGEGTPTVVGGS